MKSVSVFYVCSNSTHLLDSLFQITIGLRFKDLDFNPFVPLTIGTEVPDVMSGDQSIPSKQRYPWIQLYPDPYVMTFNNLRQTVEAIANLAILEVYRSYFISNNPIPGTG